MKERIAFLDYTRVIACIMVIFVHTCECYYLGPEGIQIDSLSNGLWVNFIDSAFRVSVPLFVLISAYLLIPVRQSMTTFYSKRMVRVVIPFIIGSILYATLPLLWGGMTADDSLAAMSQLVLNFNDASGHLWFVYMLIGLYLIMPIISPWIEKATQRELQVFLDIWFFTTFFAFFREWNGSPYLYGECFWNEFGLFWYFSGFIGYVVAANYIKRFVNWSLKRSLAICVPAFLIGYAITFYVWHGRMFTAKEIWELEISWRFCTPNVAVMSFALFILFKHLNSHTSKIYPLIENISKLSYGIYLMHIFVLSFINTLLEGRLGTGLEILITGFGTFIICYLICYLISFVPKSKYVIG